MTRRPPADQIGLFPEALPPPGEGAPRPVAAAPAGEEEAAVAAALPAGLWLGTSSWSFPGWAGIVWERAETQTRLARHGLPAYAQHPLLNAVGIDRSYYQPLAAGEYAAYAADVPRDFRFVVKAHEGLTVRRWPDHDRYGARRNQANPRFLDAAWAAAEVVAPFVEGLGEKAGPLVFQFAPQDLGAVDPFLDDLYRFLDKLPKGPVYALELRNREVLTERYGRMLEAAGAVHCVNRHPRMPEVAEQAAAVGEVGRRPFVCRWMLRPGLTYRGGYRRYHPFNKLVDEDLDTRGALAEAALASTAAGQPVFVTANNKAEGCAPLTLFRLAAEVAARRREAPPAR
jgi:uncharacterized protein YecE (DUF72 family)